MIASLMSATPAIRPQATVGLAADGRLHATSAPPQLVNRSRKSDRLLLQSTRQTDNKRLPFKLPEACKPPADVPGRCFANLQTNRSEA